MYIIHHYKAEGTNYKIFYRTYMLSLVFLSTLTKVESCTQKIVQLSCPMGWINFINTGRSIGNVLGLLTLQTGETQE